MIKINNNLDPICNLYFNNKFIGIIKNDTALMDVCAQICLEKVEGYTVRFTGKDYPIRTDGRILDPPEGFFDSIDKSMDIIFGLN